jgi:hypothetical protein
MNYNNDVPPNNQPQQPYTQGYPSYPQPQPQSPMQKLKRAWSWYLQRGKVSRIGIGCGGLIVLMFACTICSAAMAGITGANHDTTAQSTTASTPVPKPTHQVVSLAATPTPKPIPTPTPKPLTPEQVLNNIAQEQVSSHKSTTTFDGTAVIVTANASDGFTDKMIAEGCQDDAFNVEKALWTSGKLPSNVTEVDVHLAGDLKDQYGNTSPGNWAAVTLSKDTESKFNWDNLDQTSAWKVYDTAFLVANLRQALDS